MSTVNGIRGRFSDPPGVATIALVLASDYRGAYKAVYPKLPELWRMVKKQRGRQ